MQVGEPWCVIIGPNEGCHTIGPYCIASSTSPMAEQESRYVDLWGPCVWQSAQKKVVIMAGSLHILYGRYK